MMPRPIRRPSPLIRFFAVSRLPRAGGTGDGVYVLSRLNASPLRLSSGEATLRRFARQQAESR